MAAGATDHVPVLELDVRRTGRPPDDEHLVAQARRGSAQAFEQIYDRYHRRILSFCRHMLGSHEDAEDATQHVFVSAHRELRGANRKLQLRPWLFAIARNRCVDILRARRSADSLEGLVREPPSLEGLPEIVQRREDLRALLASIASLPDDQREALVLFELGGMPHRRLAEILDCRPEKVKALVYQARASLMADRHARDAECLRIREEIASSRGHQLLRSHLRRHLRVCAGCREFADEARRQRAALALVIPVLPTAGLKASTLATAGVGAVGAASAGGGLVGGFGGVFGKGVAAKALAVLCLAGVAGGASIALVRRGASAPAAAAKEPRARAAPVPLPILASVAHGPRLAGDLSTRRRRTRAGSAARRHLLAVRGPAVRRRAAAGARRLTGHVGRRDRLHRRRYRGASRASSVAAASPQHSSAAASAPLQPSRRHALGTAPSAGPAPSSALVAGRDQNSVQRHGSNGRRGGRGRHLGWGQVKPGDAPGHSGAPGQAIR